MRGPRGSQRVQAPKSTEGGPSRGKWSEELMRTAINNIKSGERSIRNASIFFSIPASSISDWMYGKTKKKRHGFDPYLTGEEEYELKAWCFKMQKMAFSITLLILKNTVQDIVRKRPRKHLFKDDRPGQTWWQCFKFRHPEVVLRMGEGLEAKRCIGLNKVSCLDFYNNLTIVITSHGYEASHVWNVEETGVQAMGRNTTLKVVAKKGSKNVNVRAADIREWLTILVCISAIGTFIPHYFILKGTYLLQNYVQDCGPGTTMNVQENGWVTNEIFCDWLDHFRRNVPGGVSTDNKHLLVLDGHCSHISAMALDTCIKMGLDIITIPSHSSHHMQPLDVSCFKPFKQNLQEDKTAMTLKNPNWGNGIMLKSTLAKMAASALDKALKPSNIISGFKATGIFPVDSSAMGRYYGPSLPLLTCVKEENEEFQENLDEEMLHQNVDNDTYEELSIDMPNEAQIVVQDSLVWPCDDPNPVTLRTSDFESLSKGQCLTDTTVDFYLKYQEKKHQYMKPGLYFFKVGQKNTAYQTMVF